MDIITVVYDIESEKTSDKVEKRSYVVVVMYFCVCAERRHPIVTKDVLFSFIVSIARHSYASAVLGVVILSVRPSVRLSVTACFVTKPNNALRMF